MCNSQHDHLGGGEFVDDGVRKFCEYEFARPGSQPRLARHGEVNQAIRRFRYVLNDPCCRCCIIQGNKGLDSKQIGACAGGIIKAS